MYKNKYNMNLNDSETKINKEQKINGLNNKIINVQKNIKTLSINMQRDRPSEWNEFFQLAMDI